MTESLRRGTSALVIARAIRSQIESGRMTHGDQIPSTRDLATEWNTSVATINRAMGILSDEGIVENRPRVGRLVNYPQQAGDQVAPKVVLIGGYAGSGKTELGRILARSTRWPILDKDTTTRPVVERALDVLGQSPSDRDSQVYLDVIRPGEYEALLATMTENVTCGLSVIITAPFVRELADQAWCDRLAARVDDLGAELHAVWVRCAPDSMHTYLRHRGAARDSWKLAHWSEYLATIDIDFAPRLPHTVIENSVDSPPLQQQAMSLVAAIR